MDDIDFLYQITKLMGGCHGKSGSLSTLLNRRELGFFNESLLLPMLKAREWKSECYIFPGNVFIEGNIVVLFKERKVFNLENRWEFEVVGLPEKDKIASCLIDYQNTCALNSPVTPFSVIILSEGGTLLAYNLHSGKQIFKYILPTGPKYKSLDLHLDGKELFVKASTKQTATGSRVTKISMIFILFTLSPFSLQHVFQLDDSISNVFLCDNILTCIYTKPHRLELHFFPRILEKLQCISREETKINIIPRLQITNSSLAFDIKGHYNSYDNVGDKFFMLIPHNEWKHIELVYLSQIEKKNLVSGTDFATAAAQETHLNIRQSPCAFTSRDDAYTIYQFIGDCLVSYDLKRNLEHTGSDLAFTAIEMWRTKLAWSFGTSLHESIIVTCCEFDFDDMFILVSVVYDVNNLDLSRYQVKCEWKAACFIIHRFNGSVERVLPLVVPSPLDTYADFHGVSHTIEMEHEVITSTFHVNGKTKVFKYSLSDSYQGQSTTGNITTTSSIASAYSQRRQTNRRR